MAKREYNGEPIDLTESYEWTANNNDAGKTVGGSSPDDNGEEKTVTWPETATEKAELNGTQRRVIEAAANPAKTYDTLEELSQDAAPDMSPGYANAVLIRHWPAGKDGIVGSSEARQTNLNEQTNTKQGLDSEFVDELRRRMLDGASVRQLREEYPNKGQTISEYAKGEREPVGETSEPPVEYDQSKHQWVPQDGEGSDPANKRDGEVAEDTPDRDPQPVTAGGGHNDADGRLKTALAVGVAFALGWVIGR